ATRSIDGRFHVTRSSVDITVQIELQCDTRITKRGTGRHLRDASDSAELTFERCGNRGSHRFGTCAGKPSAHADRWQINLRQWRNRKKAEGNHARQEYGYRDQRGRYGPANKRRGEIGLKIHP